MKIKSLYLIILFLLIGVIYRLIITQNGNFIFNMDNARDMVDIREMVELNKPRLIGNTAAIEGVFYGPYWYYLSAIPFMLSGGNPYANIILQIILWSIGGYFALKLVSRYGFIAIITVGFLWVFSNILVLSSTYAFNPNPVLFLTPLWLFLFVKYLETKKNIFSVSLFALAATFFSNEILFAILLPLIIISAIFLTGNKKLLMTRSFLCGVTTFLVVLSPQLFFELRHDFFMTHSLINFLRNGGNESAGFNIFVRLLYMKDKFNEILLPTFLNINLISFGLIGLLGTVIVYSKIKKNLLKDNLLIILLCYILIPMICFTLIPVNISSWHWVGVVSAMIVFSGILLSQSFKIWVPFKVVSLILFLAIISYSLIGVNLYLERLKRPSNDPSMFINELNAVDFVYKQAAGKNFKVYTYLPSVIDYPYQYLFWWRGLNKYGYLPDDYAYAPNKPPYITQKEKLDTGTRQVSSGLVFLIQEPDRGLRHLWENTFKNYQLLDSRMVGPLLVETRKDITQK
ncbi:MAG: hypothetical protein Q7R49_04860 [Candidatus Daviesbacteria bacterium]|nr:hypothetical protein [Candidatus Daviesbacteria bacterium]